MMLKAVALDPKLTAAWGALLESEHPKTANMAIAAGVNWNQTIVFLITIMLSSSHRHPLPIKKNKSLISRS